MDALQHKGTQTLETPRLILRRLSVDDAKDMYENWASDDEVTKYLTWNSHASVEDSRACIANFFVVGYDKPSYYEWGVVLKENGRVIGTAGLHNIIENIRSGELGYCIGSAYWGNEYMVEAVNAIIDFCFNEVNFNRIEALHDVENPKSGRVMQKLGMQYEGVRRDACNSNKGELRDCCVYAILKKDRVSNA